jgi:uncharacterized membrane protein
MNTDPTTTLSDDPGPARDSSAARLPVVDLARGLAIAQMITYHFIYDLTYFGWLHLDLTQQPQFIGWRNAIVSQFLLMVGIGIALGEAAQRSSARFWRRWCQIAAAAALVSAASAWLFGPRLIWFGILHFVAVALLLSRRLPALGLWNLLLGAGLLVLGWSVQDERFDPAWADWIGFAAHKPPTEDYVPLVPWLGVVAIGIALGWRWCQSGFALPRPLLGLDSTPARGLRWLGSWPLTIYLVHQPILMGLLWLVKAALAL